MIIIGDYEMIVSHGYTGVALDGFTILNGNWGDPLALCACRS